MQLYKGLTTKGIEQVQSRISQNCAYKRGNDWFCTFHDETLDENGICLKCDHVMSMIAQDYAEIRGY